jgi:nucleotide-binding universal stress UspA family protein
MGHRTHVRSWGHRFLGSVADRVVDIAPCTVIIVRAAHDVETA